MGYRALLFCPDEKTARAVTQVLTDLEFAVEPAAEPFAAVKKLMAEHFDAVVVDCDNEQNATLLFKSARNSTSNQSSLSVAVVEGQAGVAKAFRIGANLVLTRPINIEQAKGTLRVARGLLRKGDPAKGVAPGAPAASKPAATAPAMPSVVKPVQAAPAKPAAPVAAPRPAATAPIPAISAKPTHAAAASAHSAPAAQDPDLLELDLDDDSASDIALPAAPAIAQSAPAAAAKASKPPQSLSAAIAASQFGGGAASAPAPARSVQHEVSDTSAPVAPAAEPAPASQEEESSSTYTGSAPSFSFGGANAEPSSGGSKKTLLIVAVAVVVLAALYVGWTQFHDKISPTPTAAPQQQAPAPAPTQSVTPKIAPATKPSTPEASSSTTPAPDATASEPVQDIQIGGNASNESSDSAGEEPSAESHSGKAAGKNSAKPSNAPPAGKSVSSAKAEPTPIVVKGNSAVHPKAAAPSPDAAAPSISSIATTGGNGNLTNLISSSAQAPKPVLQTVNLSQGVSQGLLIKKVQPTYPQNALRLRQEGAVQLLATISKSGSITTVKVISGPSALAKAATDAVKQWKYKPYLLNGEPVEVQTPITVNFKLPQ